MELFVNVQPDAKKNASVLPPNETRSIATANPVTINPSPSTPRPSNNTTNLGSKFGSLSGGDCESSNIGSNDIEDVVKAPEEGFKAGLLQVANDVSEFCTEDAQAIANLFGNCGVELHRLMLGKEGIAALNNDFAKDLIGVTKPFPINEVQDGAKPPLVRSELVSLLNYYDVGSGDLHSVILKIKNGQENLSAVEWAYLSFTLAKIASDWGKELDRNLETQETLQKMSSGTDELSDDAHALQSKIKNVKNLALICSLGWATIAHEKIIPILEKYYRPQWKLGHRCSKTYSGSVGGGVGPKIIGLSVGAKVGLSGDKTNVVDDEGYYGEKVSGSAGISAEVEAAVTGIVSVKGALGGEGMLGVYHEWNTPREFVVHQLKRILQDPVHRNNPEIARYISRSNTLAAFSDEIQPGLELRAVNGDEIVDIVQWKNDCELIKADIEQQLRLLKSPNLKNLKELEEKIRAEIKREHGISDSPNPDELKKLEKLASVKRRELLSKTGDQDNTTKIWRENEEVAAEEISQLKYLCQLELAELEKDGASQQSKKDVQEKYDAKIALIKGRLLVGKLRLGLPIKLQELRAIAAGEIKNLENSRDRKVAEISKNDPTYQTENEVRDTRHYFNTQIRLIQKRLRVDELGLMHSVNRQEQKERILQENLEKKILTLDPKAEYEYRLDRSNRLQYTKLEIKLEVQNDGQISAQSPQMEIDMLLSKLDLRLVSELDGIEKVFLENELKFNLAALKEKNLPENEAKEEELKLRNAYRLDQDALTYLLDIQRYLINKQILKEEFVAKLEELESKKLSKYEAEKEKLAVYEEYRTKINVLDKEIDLQLHAAEKKSLEEKLALSLEIWRQNPSKEEIQEKELEIYQEYFSEIEALDRELFTLRYTAEKKILDHRLQSDLNKLKETLLSESEREADEAKLAILESEADAAELALRQKHQSNLDALKKIEAARKENPAGWVAPTSVILNNIHVAQNGVLEALAVGGSLGASGGVTVGNPIISASFNGAASHNEMLLIVVRHTPVGERFIDGEKKGKTVEVDGQATDEKKHIEAHLTEQYELFRETLDESWQTIEVNAKGKEVLQVLSAMDKERAFSLDGGRFNAAFDKTIQLQRKKQLIPSIHSLVVSQLREKAVAERLKVDKTFEDDVDKLVEKLADDLLASPDEKIDFDRVRTLLGEFALDLIDGSVNILIVAIRKLSENDNYLVDKAAEKIVEELNSGKTKRDSLLDQLRKSAPDLYELHRGAVLEAKVNKTRKELEALKNQPEPKNKWRIGNLVKGIRDFFSKLNLESRLKSDEKHVLSVKERADRMLNCELAVASAEIPRDDYVTRYTYLKQDFEFFTQFHARIAAQKNKTDADEANLRSFAARYGAITTEQLIHRMSVVANFLLTKTSDPELKKKLIKLDQDLLSPKFAVDQKYLKDHVYFKEDVDFGVYETKFSAEFESASVIPGFNDLKVKYERVYRGRRHTNGLRTGEYIDVNWTISGSFGAGASALKNFLNTIAPTVYSSMPAELARQQMENLKSQLGQMHSVAPIGASYKREYLYETRYYRRKQDAPYKLMFYRDGLTREIKFGFDKEFDFGVANVSVAGSKTKSIANALKDIYGAGTTHLFFMLRMHDYNIGLINKLTGYASKRSVCGKIEKEQKTVLSQLFLNFEAELARSDKKKALDNVGAEQKNRGIQLEAAPNRDEEAFNQYKSDFSRYVEQLNSLNALKALYAEYADEYKDDQADASSQELLRNLESQIKNDEALLNRTRDTLFETPDFFRELYTEYVTGEIKAEKDKFWDHKNVMLEQLYIKYWDKVKSNDYYITSEISAFENELKETFGKNSLELAAFRKASTKFQHSVRQFKLGTEKFDSAEKHYQNEVIKFEASDDWKAYELAKKAFQEAKYAFENSLDSDAFKAAEIAGMAAETKFDLKKEEFEQKKDDAKERIAEAERNPDGVGVKSAETDLKKVEDEFEQEKQALEEARQQFENAKQTFKASDALRNFQDAERELTAAQDQFIGGDAYKNMVWERVKFDKAIEDNEKRYDAALEGFHGLEHAYYPQWRHSKNNSKRYVDRTLAKVEPTAIDAKEKQRREANAALRKRMQEAKLKCSEGWVLVSEGSDEVVSLEESKHSWNPAANEDERLLDKVI